MQVNTDAGIWQNVKTVTSRSMTATGLILGTVYAFRGQAIGAAGPGA